MFVVVKGPISPTYRDQTQHMGGCCLYALNGQSHCVLALYCCSVLPYNTFLYSSVETDLAAPQAGPRGGC